MKRAILFGGYRRSLLIGQGREPPLNRLSGSHDSDARWRPPSDGAATPKNAKGPMPFHFDRTPYGAG
jgi:hypothetical protein